MTATDRPKRPGRPRKRPVARALRSVRNKHLAEHYDLRRPWHAADDAERVEQAIDASLVAAQNTITLMVINAVRHDSCDHMAMYMLQQMVGLALTLTRQQRAAVHDDAA